MPHCAPPDQCTRGESVFSCDDKNDCPPDQVCCAESDGFRWQASCRPPSECSTTDNYVPDALLLCEGALDCPGNYQCVPAMVQGLPDYQKICVPVQYGPCVLQGGVGPKACPLETDECLPFGDVVNMKDYEFCSSPCTVSSECPPAPPGNSAMRTCLDGLGGDGKTCVLDCTNEPCPEGMECVKVGTLNNGTIDICLWPA